MTTDRPPKLVAIRSFLHARLRHVTFLNVTHLTVFCVNTCSIFSWSSFISSYLLTYALRNQNLKKRIHIHFRWCDVFHDFLLFVSRFSSPVFLSRKSRQTIFCNFRLLLNVLERD